MYVRVLIYADYLLLISSACSDLRRMPRTVFTCPDSSIQTLALYKPFTYLLAYLLSKPTVQNTVTFNTAVFLYRYTAHP